MNKNTTLLLTLLTIACIGLPALYTVSHATKDEVTYTIKNNSTRNYAYEHYCDSIYIVNPDYYFDVLVETDKFQQYIDEHGEWWTN